MKSNQLPGTEVRFPQISFGAGTAAGLFVKGDRASQLDAAAAAIDVGVNHFDTAPLYGFGASETNLGAVLRELGADVLVTTKCNIPAEYLQAGSIASRVRQSVRESLSRLQRDHIDILLIHNATHLKRVLQPASNPTLAQYGNILPHLALDDLLGAGGVIEAVQELKQAGLVRYFGVSGQDNDPAALRALIGTGCIDIFNQPFHLLNPSAGFPSARGGRATPDRFIHDQPDYVAFEDVLEFARRNGVGASAISPLAAGALTEEAIALQPAPEVSQRADRFPFAGHYDRALELARLFRPVAQRFRMTLNELAYRFVLSAPGIVTVVGGFSSKDQMQQAVHAAQQGPLQEEVLRALRSAWYGFQD